MALKSVLRFNHITVYSVGIQQYSLTNQLEHMVRSLGQCLKRQCEVHWIYQVK